MLQQIGRRADLQGADIILIHRLMKNSVKEKLGVSGYGLITEAAVEAMGIAGLTDGMQEHVEPVEHFGDVRMFIHDWNFGMNFPFTLGFRPVEGGTMFSALYGNPEVEVSQEVVHLFQEAAERTTKMLGQIVEEEIAAGRIQPEQLEQMEGRKGEYRRPGVDKRRFAEAAGRAVRAQL